MRRPARSRRWLEPCGDAGPKIDRRLIQNPAYGLLLFAKTYRGMPFGLPRFVIFYGK